MIWHYRLGHPSFQCLKYLFPIFFIFFRIKCHFSFNAKFVNYLNIIMHLFLHNLTRPPNHSLWFIGMFRDLAEFLHLLKKKKRFVTFIDDHTRLTWVYLMKEKSKVETIFKPFYTMVQTQFHKKIQIFRSDNGKEYFNKILGSFFLENKYCSSKLLQWYSLTKWVSWKKKKQTPIRNSSGVTFYN